MNIVLYIYKYVFMVAVFANVLGSLGMPVGWASLVGQVRTMPRILLHLFLAHIFTPVCAPGSDTFH